MKKILFVSIAAIIIFDSSGILVAEGGTGWIPSSVMKLVLYTPIKIPPEIKLIQCCYVSSPSNMCYGPNQSQECSEALAIFTMFPE
jgi:hypothetical protein